MFTTAELSNTPFLFFSTANYYISFFVTYIQIISKRPHNWYRKQIIFFSQFINILGFLNFFHSCLIEISYTNDLLRWVMLSFEWYYHSKCSRRYIKLFLPLSLSAFFSGSLATAENQGIQKFLFRGFEVRTRINPNLNTENKCPSFIYFVYNLFHFRHLKKNNQTGLKCSFNFIPDISKLFFFFFYISINPGSLVLNRVVLDRFIMIYRSMF